MDRQVEYEKYERCYKLENYRMGDRRKKEAFALLKGLPVRGSYLDVACGRGEMLEYAASCGYAPVVGTEIVKDLLSNKHVVYGEVHKLPFDDRTFAVVSMLDVMEHLLPGDDEAACKHMKRIARNYVFMTISNKDSFGPGERQGSKVQLHVNKRPYDVWTRLLTEWFKPFPVKRLPGMWYSPGWLVTIAERSK